MKIIKYVFKVDNCLPVTSMAETLKEAKDRVVRMWPRSTVVYVSEEVSHDSSDYVQTVEPIRSNTKPMLEEVKRSQLSDMAVKANSSKTEMTDIEKIEQSLADNFSGAIA